MSLASNISADSNPIMALQDISFGVRDMSILNGVSLSVEIGQTVGIIGPNGSGKTTLFNCLSGFHRPQQGSIFFKGQDITKLGPSQRAKCGIGRVFQNPGIFREMTVLENMVTALEGRHPLHRTFMPWSSIHATIRAEAMRMLSDVKLDIRAHQKASSLSGGQMRLLEIVRSLAFGAELFLLDEPTAGVSPIMKEEVARLIRHLKELGKTVLIIEHDIQFIQLFCERIVVLDGGRVVMDGDPVSVRSSSRLQEIYFGGKA